MISDRTSTHVDNNTQSNLSNFCCQFDLVCENGWKRPFVVSIFMAGMMAGSTLGYLSDRLNNDINNNI